MSCKISWYLEDDLKRPNKMSKNIIIKMDRHLLDDYCKLTKATNKKIICNKFRGFISGKLENFNPQHTNHVDEGPPEVVWTVSSEIFR